MSLLPSIAIAGATGSLGSVILAKLIEAGFPVTVLTRQGSTSASKLTQHANQTIKEVDYASKDSLKAALNGVEIVVSTITSTKCGDQDVLIDAALASGTVKRFIPSDFGSDTSHPNIVYLPFFAAKIEMGKYLERLCEENPRFTYTIIQNNLFFDWGLDAGFLIDPKKHTATLWDGGDRPISTTTLGTVADAVIAVSKNLEATANKVMRIHDAVVTQNQLIAIVKKIDGQEWATKVEGVQEQEAESFAEMKKPDGDIQKAMVGFLAPVIWGEKVGPDFTNGVDNGALGLKEMSEAEVEAVVRKSVQG